MEANYQVLLKHSKKPRKQDWFELIPPEMLIKGNSDIEDPDFFNKLFQPCLNISKAFLVGNDKDQEEMQYNMRERIQNERNRSFNNEDSEGNQQELMQVEDESSNEKQRVRKRKGNIRNKNYTPEKKELKNMNMQIKSQVADQGEKTLRGLKDLSLRVKQILLKKYPLSYRQVAYYLINESSIYLKSIDPQTKARQEQNIKRRVYDALNVLIAAQILRKQGKKICPFSKKRPKIEILIQKRLQNIKMYIQNAKEKLIEILKIRQKLQEVKMLSSLKLAQRHQSQKLTPERSAQQQRSNQLLLQIDEIRKKNKIQTRLRRKQRKRLNEQDTIKTKNQKQKSNQKQKPKQKQKPSRNSNRQGSTVNEQNQEDELLNNNLPNTESKQKTKQSKSLDPPLNKNKKPQIQYLLKSDILSNENQELMELALSQIQRQLAIKKLRLQRIQKQSKLHLKKSVQKSKSQYESKSKNKDTNKNIQRNITNSFTFNSEQKDNSSIPFPTGIMLIKGNYQIQRKTNGFSIISDKHVQKTQRWEFFKMIFDHSEIVDKLDTK